MLKRIKPVNKACSPTEDNTVFAYNSIQHFRQASHMYGKGIKRTKVK